MTDTTSQIRERKIFSLANFFFLMAMDAVIAMVQSILYRLLVLAVNVSVVVAIVLLSLGMRFLLFDKKTGARMLIAGFLLLTIIVRALQGVVVITDRFPYLQPPSLPPPNLPPLPPPPAPPAGGSSMFPG